MGPDGCVEGGGAHVDLIDNGMDTVSKVRRDGIGLVME